AIVSIVDEEQNIDNQQMGKNKVQSLVQMMLSKFMAHLMIRCKEILQAGQGKCGIPEVTFATFEKMIYGQEYIKPDTDTYNWLIQAYTRAESSDRVQDVAHLLGMMVEDYKRVQPNVKPMLFRMETHRETLTEGTEGALHLGPERPQVYSDLTSKEKERYNADIQATNIILQGLPKDIYSLINHYTDAKDIWDNVKRLLEGLELTKEDRESQLQDVVDVSSREWVALDEEQLLFVAGEQDNAIDEDVDEQPVQNFALNADNTMFMANLSSVYPVCDEVGSSREVAKLPKLPKFKVKKDKKKYKDQN
nr:pentatricopeptide repeat-containing protein At2g35130-like isoform X1 [Tanacetum cinerariifolium]